MIKYLTKKALCDLMSKTFDWNYRIRPNPEAVILAVLIEENHVRFPVLVLDTCTNHEDEEDHHHTCGVVLAQDHAEVFDCPVSFYESLPEHDFEVDISIKVHTIGNVKIAAVSARKKKKPEDEHSPIFGKRASDFGIN